MKTAVKRFISIILCISMLMGMIVVGDAYDDRTYAYTQTNADYSNNEAICGEGNYPTTALKTDPEADLGESGNPFVVLEVVPTLDQAQFGYFIPGCEPIDMEAAERDYEDTAGDLNLTQGNWTIVEKDIYSLYEDIPSNTPYSISVAGGWGKALTDYHVRTFENGYRDSGSTNYNCWIQSSSDSGCNVKGYFEKVTDGTGNYVRAATEYQAPFNVDPTDNAYYFKYEEGGDYKWVTTDAASDGDTNKVWMTRNDGFKCHVKHRINNDTLIKKAFGYYSTDFISKVVTITPELLKDHMNLIADADLIVFHTANNTSSTMGLWTKYNKQHIEGIDSNGSAAKFADHDLTNEMVIQIMQRMGTDNPPALVFEMSPWDSNSINTNLDKLMLMSMQFKPKDFCEKLLLLDAVKNQTEAAGSSTLVYNNETTWNTKTFTKGPDGADITDQMRAPNLVSAQHNIFEKILTYNGNNSLFQLFLSTDSLGFDDANDYYQDMVDYYEGKKNKYSMMDAMKFILSIPQYTPKLRVLEIEPCQQFIYKNDSFKTTIDGKEFDWVKYYENLFPWYDANQDSGSWVEDTERLQVTTMTTAEFIGSTGRYEYGQVDNLNNPIKLTIDSSDDLTAKYDLIIIGAMQDESNGLNGYNDEDLGNLLYTSVGDLVFRYADQKQANESGITSNKDSYAGWDADGTAYDKQLRCDFADYKMRYSGNDITLKKMLELEDFLRAGKPIVVDQKLYKEDGSEIDTEKVDKSSKLYDLLTWNDPDSDAEERILRYNDYSPKQMKKIIAKSRCQLVFVNATDGYPMEYGYSQEDQKYSLDGSNGTASGVIVNENYQPKDASGNAVLSYHFYIDGVIGQKYRVHLSIDSDGDGVYRGSLKEHSEIDNMNQALGKEGDEKDSYDTVENTLSMQVFDEDGTALGNSTEVELEPNKRYYATYTLPKSRLGIVPWKLEVYHAGNQYLRSSAIDYTAFEKGNDKTKERINVLQMCLPPMRKATRGEVSSTPYNDKNGIYKTSLWKADRFSSFTRYSVNLGGHQYYDPDYDYTNSSDTRIYDNYMKSNSGKRTTVAKFEKYLENVNEFDVNIQFLINSDWYVLFGDTSVDAEGKTVDQEQRIENWKSFLAEYDMVVLGFIDSNSFSEDPVFVEGINDFINQGKSMIFSHDLVQSPDAENVGNYGDYSTWLRTVSGQRRSYYNKESDGTYDKTYSNTFVNGKEIFSQSELKTAYESTRSDDMRDVYFHQFTDADDDKVLDNDFNSVEYSFKDTYTCEIMDNAAQMYARYRSKARGKTDRVKNANSTNDNLKWPDNSAGTSFVRLANNGQITSYPYKLNDVIQVLNSHVQNYQLDMEYQTYGDVNVWFNLTDTYDPDIYGNSTLISGDSSENKTDAYSSKMQDSRNNFYIYNKGNITYTGSGHGDAHNGKTNCQMTDDEVKLFVNTMISAYRPPEQGPYVSIDNASSVSSNGDSLLYVDYDTVKKGADIDDEVVDSDVLDSNVVTINGEKMVRVEFTVRDDSVADGEQTQEGEPAAQQTQYLLNIKSVVGETKTDLEISEIVPAKNSGASSPLLQKSSSKFYIVDANKQYVIYVPYNSVAQSGNLNYEFTAYSTYYKENRKCRTPKETTNLDVMILPLFNLN
ncbi:MAG: DUF5057 domain-containing protein [Agathobacter sp.]